MPVFPVQGYNAPINLHWGDVKGGSDLFAPRGTPVLNMAGGRVISAGWDNVGGWSVLVNGEDGNQYYYAHLDKAPSVQAGQTIPEGTYLGPVGNTGDAAHTQTHLHIGIGPKILLGADKYGGTGGDFDAVTMLKNTLGGGAAVGTAPKSTYALDYNDKEAVSNYIRQAAIARNIDPEIAVAIAGGEGLHTYIGDNNSSFGPFQLHYGGRASGGNAVGGLGDAFTKQTGLDARDQSTIAQQIDFSLDNAATNGWGAWHAAPRLGIGPFAGISKNSKPIGITPFEAGNTQPNFNQNLSTPDPWSGYPQWIRDAARGSNPNQSQLTPFGFNNFKGDYFQNLFGMSPYNNIPPQLRGPIPGSELLPYIPSLHGQFKIEPIPNAPIRPPGYDWTNDLTPLSQPGSIYNAPTAQPDIMARMARPWSLYG